MECIAIGPAVNFSGYLMPFFLAGFLVTGVFLMGFIAAIVAVIIEKFFS